MELCKEVIRAKFLIKTDSVVFLRFPNGLFHSLLFKVSQKLNIERIITGFLVFHEYCFTPGFIRRLLSDHGFADIEVYNASLSGGSLIHRFRRLHGLPYVLPLGSLIFSFVTRSIEAAEKLTDLIHRLRRLHGLARGSLVSGGRLLWGPSLEVIARKKAGKSHGGGRLHFTKKF